MKKMSDGMHWPADEALEDLKKKDDKGLRFLVKLFWMFIDEILILLVMAYIVYRILFAQ